MIEGKNEEMSTSELSGGARIHYIFQSIFVKSLEVCIFYNTTIVAHLACLRHVFCWSRLHEYIFSLLNGNARSFIQLSPKS